MIRILVGGQEVAMIVGCGKLTKVIDPDKVERITVSHQLTDKEQADFGQDAQISVEFRSNEMSIVASNQGQYMTLLRETYETIAKRCELRNINHL